MANFYEELRESRLARGISIEDISNVTKINPLYLNGIETGEYDLLPEPYIVLFIKAYAKEIGIDPDDAARRYRLFRSAEQLPKEKRRARRELADGTPTPEKAPAFKSANKMFWLGGGALFLIVLLSVKFCSIEDPESFTAGSESDAPNGLTTGESEAELPLLDSLGASASADSDSVSAHLADDFKPPMISLRIISMDSSRVRVVVIPDDGDPDDITFQMLGEEQIWRAYEQFSLRISKTRAVAIYLDDKLLDYLGPANTWVSRAIINRDGIDPEQTILRTRN